MKTIITFLFILTVFSTVFAAGEVDPAFNGSAFVQPEGFAYVVALQPDGKILVAGQFEVTNNFGRNLITRLNADGTVDASFVPPDFGTNGNIESIAVQPDGKILVGGRFIFLPGGVTNNPLIFRLNANGSLDASFQPNGVSTGSPDVGVLDIVVLPDGKILIGGNFSYRSPTDNLGRSKIARLNPNGTNDDSFRTSGFLGDVADLEVQPDGKILSVRTSGGGSNVFIKRLNADGSYDENFSALVNADFSSNFLQTIKVQADGKILIGGYFNNINGVAKNGIARLNSDGTLDSTFAANLVSQSGVNRIEIDANGRILVSGSFTYSTVPLIKNLIRLDSNGNLDNSFTFDYNASRLDFIEDFKPLPDGKIIVIGRQTRNSSQRAAAVRLNSNGTIDTSFSLLFGTKGTVTDIVVQPDGKILVSGVFGAISAFARPSIARFNADGTADTSFNPIINALGANQDPIVRAIALQPDGKILIGGQFADMLVRLNSDGTRDTTFTANISTANIILDAVVLPDGKILVSLNTGIIRLLPNGSVDSSFQSLLINSQVSRILVQPDGKILIGGGFTTVNGLPRQKIARLNANGTLDSTFNPSFGGVAVYDIGLQPDGKIIAGGDFTVSGASILSLARLNADGSLDSSFNAGLSGAVFALKVQPDGKIIIGGSVASIAGVSRNRLARLTANGTLDLTFNVGTGANSFVYSLALQTDGKVLAGGNFSKFNDVSRISIVRLLNTSKTAFDFDGDGRADVSLFRPSNGIWYILPSQTNGFYGFPFGQASDLIAPADYDGDGKTDVAVFRPVVAGAGDQAYFYILNSADNSFRAVGFGTNGDVPVSGDWDGDGKADLAVYRVTSSFYYRPSSQPSVNFITLTLGVGGKPVQADYDGDGRLDPAVWNASSDGSGVWRAIYTSSNQVNTITFGAATDIPTPADFDGDGKANFAVFRPSNGTWYTSQNPATNFGAIVFGANGDLPVPADYDGDGRADAAVFRPTTGAWFLNRTTSGLFGVQFGASGDKPTPNAFVR